MRKLVKRLGWAPHKPEQQSLPNPVRLKLDAELRTARAEIELVVAEYGLEAFENPEDLPRTMRGFKIAHAAMGRRVLAALKKVVDLERKRSGVPARVPVRQVVGGEVVKRTRLPCPTPTPPLPLASRSMLD